MNFAFEIGSYSVNPICLPVNIDSKRFWKNLRRYFIAGKIWHRVELEMRCPLNMQLFYFQGWGDHQSTLDETGKIRRNTYFKRTKERLAS